MRQVRESICCVDELWRSNSPAHILLYGYFQNSSFETPKTMSIFRPSSFHISMIIRMTWGTERWQVFPKVPAGVTARSGPRAFYFGSDDNLMGTTELVCLP